MEFVTLLRQLTFQTLRQLLLQRRPLQKVDEITFTIKGKIQAVTKISQSANRAIIEIRMTRTANKNSPGVYMYSEGRPDL